MSAADWWRVGYGIDFANNIERIACSLERISKSLAALVALAAESEDEEVGDER